MSDQALNTVALADAVHVADVQLCAVEAGLAAAEARLHLFGAALARLRKLAREGGLPVLEAPPQPTGSPRNMSREEFATHMRISMRTVDKHRKRMSEQVDYHRDGKRVIFHLPEAEVFVRNLPRTAAGTADVEVLAMDEVTRRRAMVLLKKARGKS